MPRGPIPNPNRRRTNAPAIPTTVLPVAGRSGSAPRPPKSVKLYAAGLAWWKWAWHTPQAAAWDSGSLYDIAHRASLEDDLATCAQVQGLDVEEFLDIEATPATQRLGEVIRGLASLATGKIAIERQIQELDKVLGLTPKGRLDLRWTLGEPDEKASKTPIQPSSVRRLRAVESGAVAGA